VEANLGLHFHKPANPERPNTSSGAGASRGRMRFRRAAPKPPSHCVQSSADDDDERAQEDCRAEPGVARRSGMGIGGDDGVLPRLRSQRQNPNKEQPGSSNRLAPHPPTNDCSVQGGLGGCCVGISKARERLLAARIASEKMQKQRDEEQNMADRIKQDRMRRSEVCGRCCALHI
jgi:hypothetical protein